MSEYSQQFQPINRLLHTAAKEVYAEGSFGHIRPPSVSSSLNSQVPYQERRFRFSLRASGRLVLRRERRDLSIGKDEFMTAFYCERNDSPRQGVILSDKGKRFRQISGVYFVDERVRDDFVSAHDENIDELIAFLSRGNYRDYAAWTMRLFDRVVEKSKKRERSDTSSVLMPLYKAPSP